MHLELERTRGWMRSTPLVPSGEVLLLAGDIMTMDEPWDEFVDFCARSFRHTFIVPGNHEYFGKIDLDDTLDNFELNLRPNVAYVNNRRVRIGDTELFFTTLWTPIDPAMYEVAQNDMPDFGHINYRGKPLEPCHYADVHRRCLAWLDKALAASNAPHKVVVTHHCPIEGEDPAYADNGLESVFCVPLDEFIARSGADYWIYGHTHHNALSGQVMGRTTLLANQLGSSSRGPRPGFSPSATFVC
ncbi:MAG: metallophosphoesterase [Muribaculaceae bacterium]|nr:metallophosphoesterase [Muribaculaceae bacterium]